MQPNEPLGLIHEDALNYAKHSLIFFTMTAENENSQGQSPQKK
ncbi:UNVERIFIED_ORG: hypothetical protein ABRZ91_001656 [Heyndrickxia coagulans]